LRLALRGLEQERGDIRPLEGELKNYHRLRVGVWRIIFRYGPVRGGVQTIYCAFAENRSIVYLLLEELLSRGLKKPEC
jgi:mRNA-degrading endonuclease RelE of RelBE toxin-antitoxin system